MSDDPLADVLRLTEARSLVAGGFATGGRWALRFPVLGQLVFSAIVKGGCWLRLDRQREPVRLEEGDIGLLPGRDGFVLCSDLRAKPVDVELGDAWGEITQLGDGTGCGWLAGRVTLDPGTGELLTRSLPALVHLRASSPGAASLRWIVNELVEEHSSTRPGAIIAAAQLAQLFFVKILREHLASAELTTPGLLRAMGDERLARAMRLMHDTPARDFRLDELAQCAGMSRTRFALHFKALAGVSPLTYLTQWRMRLAQRALRDSNVPIANLAASLGYASDSAFSSAFKRVTGVAPRDYRTARQPAR